MSLASLCLRRSKANFDIVIVRVGEGTQHAKLPLPPLFVRSFARDSSPKGRSNVMERFRMLRQEVNDNLSWGESGAGRDYPGVSCGAETNRNRSCHVGCGGAEFEKRRTVEQRNFVAPPTTE